MHIDKRTASEDELDLREVLKTLWKDKIWIVATTVIAAVLSVTLALWLPNIYRAQALLAAYEESSGGLNSLAAQYGGLASLAGVSLSGNAVTEKSIGIETLKSRKFITEFIDRRNVLIDLMAAQSFNLQTGEVGYDDRIYDAESQIWTREVKPPRQPMPSALQAYEAFAQIYNVYEDLETGFVSITIEHLSPIVAEKWVRWIIEDINQEMMDQANLEAQHSINYLTEQLENTQVVALEEIFYSLIEEQTKTMMLASARPEYLFKTIDPAVVMEEKAKPRRALICVLGTILGGMLGVLLVLVRQYSHAIKAS